MLITKAGSKLAVGAMNHENNHIAKKIFDLKGHVGERVRVHIDTEGRYTVKTNPRQKLLVCEIDIPARKYVHTQKVVHGITVVESKEKELKLGEIHMIEYQKGVNKI